MRLGLIQMHAASIGEYYNTADRILKLIEDICQKGVDLVLLPECAYPAYLIGNDPNGNYLQHLNYLLSEIAKKARLYQAYIVMGVSLPHGEKLYNSAIVFDKMGDYIGEAHKSNLWHFDAKWFSVGETGFTFDTEFGKLGVMVCADGRIPEIARKLRLEGAQLILDAVNLVASSEVASSLSNQQYEFILPIRAWENNIPIAVCDKVGIEEDCVCCLGRSFVALPDASIPVQCSPDKEEMLIYDVTIPNNKPINFPSQLYSILTTPSDQTPIAQEITKCYCPKEMELYSSVVRFIATSQADYVRQSIDAMNSCRTLDAKFVVLPFAGSLSDESCTEIISRCPDSMIAILLYMDKDQRYAIIFNSNKLLYKIPLCANIYTSTITVATLFNGCKVSVLFDDAFYSPEFSRVAMLQGADILVWYDTQGNIPDKKLSQTRAAENKCFVIRSGPNRSKERSYAISPDGAQLFTTFFTEKQISCGIINLFLSNAKTVVPGTHIVYSRVPEYYNPLIKEM